jgi:hypothetical protein
MYAREKKRWELDSLDEASPFAIRVEILEMKWRD